MDSADLRSSVMQAWDVRTPWTLLLHASDLEKGSSSLEKLLIVYSDPIYAYYRREGLSAADAEDLAQQLLMSFFLVRQSHKAVNRKHGRFRDYLLASARNLLLDWRKGLRTKQRGGGLTIHSLEELRWEGGKWEPMNSQSAEEEFEKQWARATWLAALEAFRQRFPVEQVDPINLFYSGPRISQEEAAAKLGVSVACFNSRLHTGRQKLLELLRELVLATVEDESDVNAEMQHVKDLLLR